MRFSGGPDFGIARAMLPFLASSSYLVIPALITGSTGLAPFVAFRVLVFGSIANCDPIPSLSLAIRQFRNREKRSSIR